MQDFKTLKKKILKDPKVKEYYRNLGPGYALIEQVIESRLKKGLSQRELAKKVGTKQSAISRFESGNYNPSLGFLIKISKALDSSLCISME